ncbi:m7GpppN-mRNA hydrolase-like [Wyeomyia smithii]|uniref:m7GpppN-mRNA hydrolase-like n=1 Tax=Wyeomyia smithii TaxID=174621 RepID=UPI002467CA24|nr:m7GpppN-mRNA hydrolase-like [Wyeomyia smithii]
MATNSPVSTIVSANTTSTKPKANQQQSQTISSGILDDLGARFIINVPVEERQNLIRICFQIELAHWFYLDFYCSSVQKQKCGIKQFAFQLFQRIPFLQPHLLYVDKILEDWKQYKLSVPTYGAILLSEDMEQVLLVQSFWAKSSWGFPKGKINENEEPINCAIREVYEETGYDIKNLIVPSEYIELVINYQYTRLYLVRGVPLSTVFVPRTRNEIKCCEWFPIELLPVTKNENFVKDNHSLNGSSFFMILPFVKRLKKWLEKLQKNKHKPGNNNSPVFGSAGKQSIKYFENKTPGQSNNRQRQRHKSMGDLDQQQRSKSNGTKNVPNTAGAPTEGHSDFGPSAADFQPGGSTTNKKNNKKQVHHEVGINSTIAGSVGGRTQIKRKLFDTVVDEKSPAAANSDPYLAFNESKSWISFKLDYSKFL